jgi:hypothetical protein
LLIWSVPEHQRTLVLLLQFEPVPQPRVDGIELYVRWLFKPVVGIHITPLGGLFSSAYSTCVCCFLSISWCYHGSFIFSLSNCRC